MIGRISGKLIGKNPPTVCIDVGGIGYEIDVPMTTLYDLPAIGAQVTLHTHMAVRDDAHTLYGFSSASDRTAFRTLIKISGIGARTALAILSGLTVNELAQTIAEQEPARLLKVPGIGKKTAERLLLELKGKLDTPTNQPGQPKTTTSSGKNDIIDALTSLGYSNTEAQKAFKTLPEGIELTEGIRLALKSLA